MSAPRSFLARAKFAALIPAFGVALLLAWCADKAEALDSAPAPRRRCPFEMVEVNSYCIDRFEAQMVDKATNAALSPFYPPQPRLMRDVFRAWERLRHITGDRAARNMPLPAISDWQKTTPFEPKALSRAGVVPQGYTSYYSAKKSCENAGKRLCTNEEWLTACKGEKQTKHPYGDTFATLACNVYGTLHPAFVLHGVSSMGHLDPRLNLLAIAGDAPVLRLTGSSPRCASRWGNDAVMDMVGNLDEWVEADRDTPNGKQERAIFRGGFYARSTTNGCEAEVTNHSKLYFDYSTGVRCCLTPE